MQVRVQHLRGVPRKSPANHRVAGRDAFLYPAHDELELLDDDLYLSARIGKGYAGFGVDDAALVLAGLRMGDPEDLPGWPVPLVAAPR